MKQNLILILFFPLLLSSQNRYSVDNLIIKTVESYSETELLEGLNTSPILVYYFQSIPDKKYYFNLNPEEFFSLDTMRSIIGTDLIFYDFNFDPLDDSDDRVRFLWDSLEMQELYLSHYNGLSLDSLENIFKPVNGSVFCKQGNMGEINNSVRVRKWDEWNENGQLISQGKYKNGKKEGMWKNWDNDGVLTSQIKYKNNLPLKLKEVKSYSQGKLVADLVFRNEIGSGIVTAYGANGEIGTKISYKDNLMHGNYIFYLENGVKAFKTKFKKGTGLIRMFYKSGQIMIETCYINDYKNGLEKEWFESDQLKTESNYVKGKLSGKQKKWHENGQLSSEGSFKEGKIISIKCWDRDGNEIKCNN